MKSKYEDNDFDEDEYDQNENQIQTLETFLNSNQNVGDNVERGIYEEEENKIEEWNNRIKKQDEQLDEIHKGVGKLKKEAGMAGVGINKIGDKVKNLNKHTDKTQKSLNSQNARLKDLVNKIRRPDKYCCDIILILIVIGLLCTLYSVVKHKY